MPQDKGKGQKGTEAQEAVATPAVATAEAPATEPVLTPAEIEAQEMQKAEDLQKQIQEITAEAVRISAFDPAGSKKLFASLSRLVGTQGVALREKTLQKMDVHKKEIVENLSGAFEQINAYATKHNLPAMMLRIGVGYSGQDAAQMNGPRFEWAGASAKPVRIRTGHKRSGTLSKEGKEIGKFDSATAAAKKYNLSLVAKNQTTGKEYEVPATKALKDAGFTWIADVA